MKPFINNSAAMCAHFGAGSVAQAEKIGRALGMNRVLVACTRSGERAARAMVAGFTTLEASLFAQAAMHTPVAVTARATERARGFGADGVISLGGGSAIGLGKALGVRLKLPHLAIPTTYAGSEMTDILGETENGVKTTRRDPAIRPAAALYDVELTLSLGVETSVVSGFNAIAHAAEALYAADGDPLTSLTAEEGARALARALPRIVQDVRDLEARSEAFYGAWLCGVCLGRVSMALHHKLCHTLGGRFDLPHAETHAVLLPHAFAFNAQAAPEAAARLALALGADPAAPFARLISETGAPISLAALGMPESGIEAAAAAAVKTPYPNPRAFTEADIAALLRRAWAGDAPTG